MPVVEAPLLESGRRRGYPGRRTRPRLPGFGDVGGKAPDASLRHGLERGRTGAQPARAGRRPGGDRDDRPQPRPLRPYDRPQRAGEAARAPAAAGRSSRRLAEAAGRHPRAGALRATHDQQGEGPRRGLRADRATAAVLPAGRRPAGDGGDRAHHGVRARAARPAGFSRRGVAARPPGSTTTRRWWPSCETRASSSSRAAATPG